MFILFIPVFILWIVNGMIFFRHNDKEMIRSVFRSFLLSVPVSFVFYGIMVFTWSFETRISVYTHAIVSPLYMVAAPAIIGFICMSARCRSGFFNMITYALSASAVVTGPFTLFLPLNNPALFYSIEMTH
jgi:hypothetical protein